MTTHKLKPLAPGQLAQLYGITVNRLNAWLKPHRKAIGKRHNTYYYSIKQVKIVFSLLGDPFEEVKV